MESISNVGIQFPEWDLGDKLDENYIKVQFNCV